MHKQFLLSTCMASVFMTGLAGAVETAPLPVPVPGPSLMNQRYIDVEPIRKDPVIKWKVASISGVAKEEWSNCIVHNGVMYGSAKGVLHAIDVESGKLLWTVKGPGGHPAIQGNTLYAAGEEKLFAIDLATGKIKRETVCSPMLCDWAQSYGFMKPAVVIQDGIAYFGAKSNKSEDCNYHAVDIESGKLLWKAKPKNEPWTARLCVGGGRLYGSSHRDPIAPGNPEIWGRPKQGEAIVAMDLKTGAVLWTRDGVSSMANPVYQDEVVYIGLMNAVEALDAKTGKILWTAPAPVRSVTKNWPEGGMITGLALHDNVLLACGAGATLIAIDIKTQKELWRFKQPEIAEILNPVICRDVVLVTTAGRVGGDDPAAGGRNSPIYGLDLKTGNILWQCKVPGTDCPPAENKKFKSFNSYVCGWAYPEGKRLFVFSFTGYFYCFEQP